MHGLYPHPLDSVSTVALYAYYKVNGSVDDAIKEDNGLLQTIQKYFPDHTKETLKSSWVSMAVLMRLGMAAPATKNNINKAITHVPAKSQKKIKGIVTDICKDNKIKEKETLVFMKGLWDAKAKNLKSVFNTLSVLDNMVQAYIPDTRWHYFKKGCGRSGRTTTNNRKGHMWYLVPPDLEAYSRIGTNLMISRFGSAPKLTAESILPIERVYKKQNVTLNFGGDWPAPHSWPKNAAGMKHCTKEELEVVFDLDLGGDPALRPEKPVDDKEDLRFSIRSIKEIFSEAIESSGAWFTDDLKLGAAVAYRYLCDEMNKVSLPEDEKDIMNTLMDHVEEQLVELQYV